MQLHDGFDVDRRVTNRQLVLLRLIWRAVRLGRQHGGGCDRAAAGNNACSIRCTRAELRAASLQLAARRWRPGAGLSVATQRACSAADARTQRRVRVCHRLGHDPRRASVLLAGSYRRLVFAAVLLVFTVVASPSSALWGLLLARDMRSRTLL